MFQLQNYLTNLKEHGMWGLYAKKWMEVHVGALYSYYIAKRNKWFLIIITSLNIHNTKTFQVKPVYIQRMYILYQAPITYDKFDKINEVQAKQL